MPINKERMKKFNRDIAELENSIGFEGAYEVFKARLLDLIAKREIEGDTLRSYMRKIEKILNPEYITFVQDTYTAYEETIVVVNDYYSDIGSDVNRNLQKVQAIEKANLTRLGAYKDATVRRIAKVVRKGISEGKQHTEIAKQLANVDDAVTSYANTLARTQVKGYSQTLKNEKARIGEVFFFEYFGIKRENTRTFCLELLGQADPTFHMNDIKQMKNGQIGNPFEYRGGFNCHHDWEPNPGYNKQYAVSFYRITENKRTLKLARRK